MNIIKVSSEQEVIDSILSIIRNILEKNKILLLLPGGSAAKIGIGVINQLSPSDQAKLTVSLTDERYGLVGHNDSNWTLLKKLGLPNNIASLPVLKDLDPETTCNEWSSSLNTFIQGATIICLLGIGNDYHTAGIKPGYEFAKDKIVQYYTAEDFERITITPRFFGYVDYSIIYAEGADKADAIENLTHNISSDLQPMQLIKDSKHSLVYYYPK